PACRALGYEPADLVGAYFSDFAHPDDKARFVRNRTRYLSGAPLDSLDHRYRFVGRDGAIQWLEGNPTTLSDETGEAVGIVNTFRDVSEQVAAETALAASEARYRLIAEKIPDIFVQTDKNGRIEYISPACRKLGFEPAELVGSKVSDVTHPEDR